MSLTATATRRTTRRATRRTTRRTGAGLAALVAGAALLLTGCGPHTATPAKANQSVSTTDDAQLKEMQQKVAAAESSAAQADSDATQNN